MNDMIDPLADLHDGYQIAMNWFLPLSAEHRDQVIRIDPAKWRALPLKEWASEMRRIVARRPHLATSLLRTAPIERLVADTATWDWLVGVAEAVTGWRDGQREEQPRIREYRLKGMAG